MTTNNRITAEEVKKFCAFIGNNSLLVQGPGGNISWKDGDILWIKASGTWIADAIEKDIFVPVDLKHLLTAIAVNDFSVTPRLMSINSLKPSIETLLHALLPQRIVLHLHAVEVLTHLIIENFEKYFYLLLNGNYNYIIVDYFKPGAALAKEIKKALNILLI